MKLPRYLPDYIKLWLDHRGRRIAIVEITLRTLLRMFLLRPTHQNTELIRGVIGRAQAKPSTTSPSTTITSSPTTAHCSSASPTSPIVGRYPYLARW
jgi:hypothetical protein